MCKKLVRHTRTAYIIVDLHVYKTKNVPILMGVKIVLHWTMFFMGLRQSNAGI